MSDPLNQYGDQFKPTDDGHGVDIASQRQDELDIASLAAVREQAATGNEVQAVDLGGGFGAHSIRMAEAGATVRMVDVSDMASANFSKSAHKDRLFFIKKDFVSLSESDFPAPIDVLYSQRAIHYMPYNDAKRVLSMLFNRMSGGGKAAIFISAAGWDTEYGKTYPDRDRPVEERFAFVTQDMQKKHGITHKIVTYREEEMSALLEAAGFSDIKVTRSAFGNIKATARKL